MNTFSRDMTPDINLTRERGAGAVRHQRPLYVDLLPPCNDGLPGRREYPGLARSWRRPGKYREAWEALIRDNPLPGGARPGLLSPVRDAAAIAASSTARSAFTRSSGSSATWPLDAGLADAASTSPPTGKRVLVVGAGPSGLSAAYHLTRLGPSGGDPRRRPAARRHAAFRHSRLSPAARRPDEGDRAHRARWACKIVLNHKVDDVLAEQTTGAFDAVFIAIGAQVWQACRHPGARRRQGAGRRVRCCTTSEAGAAPRLGRRVVVYGGGNTAMDAARTVRRLGAEEALIVYRRDRAHMPAHDFEADEALAEGVKIKWLTHDQGHRRRRSHGRDDALDENGRAAADRRVRDAQGRHRWCWRSASRPTAASCGRFPESSSRPTARVVVAPNMMTGRAGIFAGGDMVPGERTVTVGDRPRQEGGAPHRRLAARRDAIPHPAEAPRDRASPSSICRSTPTRRARLQHELPVAQRERGFDEVVGGLSETRGACTRRSAACPAATASSATTAYAACPEEAIVKLGPGRATRSTRRCTGCAVCFEQCPCHAIEMIPEPTEVRT